MSYFGIDGATVNTTDYLIEVAKGNVAGASLINKFGANTALASSYEPVSIGGIYRTQQVGSAQTLRVKAGNVNDTAAGLGAREITIEGLDATGALQTASVATAGGSASANFSGTWIRVFRAYVSASGVYATQGGGSHAGDIVVEDSTGTFDWLTIDATSFAKGQSQIACYSVPLGFTAFVLDYSVTMNANKTVDFTFFKRENILETAAPYSAMRLAFQEIGLTQPFNRKFSDPLVFPELTDVGVMAQGQQSPEVTADFNILLIDNTTL